MSNGHEYSGVCDLCGIEADSEVAEITGLSCSSKHEPNQIFHQACVEKYLKGLRLERNRKSGFPCPRGCGKAPTHTETCKGKITKSHPVTIRGEGNKKRRQAELESLQKATLEQSAKGKGSKESSPTTTSSKTEKKTTTSTSSSHSATPVLGGKKGKPVPTKPVIIRALNVANPRLTSLPPPKTVAELQRESLQAARDRLRAEIATNNCGAGAASSSSSSLLASASRVAKPPAASSSSSTTTIKKVMTLDEYMAARSASNASTIGGGTTKLGETPRSSSAASSAPSAAAAAAATPAAAAAGAAGSRPTMANAWSRMTSLGEQNTTSTATTAAAAAAAGITLQSSMTTPPPPATGEYFPETPGRETFPSSYTHSEEHTFSAAPTPNRVATTVARVAVGRASLDGMRGSGTVTPREAAGGAGTGTAGTTPRASEASSSFVEIIPGLIDHSKLTKAQRKNLKRAEKKAAARVEETSSIISGVTDSHAELTTEPSSLGFGGGDDYDHHQHHQFGVHSAVLHETGEDTPQHALNTNANNYFGETPPLQPTSPVNGSSNSSGDGGEHGRIDDGLRSGSISQESLECLVSYKLNNTISELCRLGFPFEACSRTAIACGGDLHSSIQDLLVSESGAESLYPPGTEAPVDISEELAAVQLLKQRYGNVVPLSSWDVLIVQCMGNLNEVVRRLEAEENMVKMQYQQHAQQQAQQQQVQQQHASVPVSSSHGGGGGGSDGLGSLFTDSFGLPDEIMWGQSASQHPAASTEWDSLLNGSGNTGGGGSLFDTGGGAISGGSNINNNTSFSTSLFGISSGITTNTTTSLTDNASSVRATGIGGVSSLGFGLNLGFSSPSSPSPPQFQNQQQQQYQQTEPRLMPGISHQQQHLHHNQGGSSNFSGNNTVLSGGGGGVGDLWGSATTVGGSFGAVAGNGSLHGYGGNGNSATTGLTSSLSYDANNSGGVGGYLNQNHNQSPSPLNNTPTTGDYGMIKNQIYNSGMQQYPSYAPQQPQPQPQQMQYTQNGNGGGGLWSQPHQQQPQQARNSFDGSHMHSNTGFVNDTGNGTGYPGAGGGAGAMMMALVQDQANQEQRELQSLMGNLGLYSS